MKNDNCFAMKPVKPKVGDILRTTSCTGDPQVTALHTLKSRDLTSFSDIVNDHDDDFAGKHPPYPLPADHWINCPLPDEGDKTLLNVAIENGLHDYIEILLSAGANANLLNDDLGKAPIHFAAQRGDLKAIKLLLRNERNKADINNVMRSSGRTALHICIEEGYDDCVYFLLSQAEINVNIADKKRKQTPLYLAAKRGTKDLAKVLIEAGADLNHVCFGKSVEQHLREKILGFDPKSYHRTKAPVKKELSTDLVHEIGRTIEKAALANDENRQELLEHFKSLLLQVSDGEANILQLGGYSLLQKTIVEDLPEFVKALLEEVGVDPNHETTSVKIAPILLACSTGNVESLKQLIKHKALLTVTSNQTQESVLHCLLKQGPHGSVPDCLVYLLETPTYREQITGIVNKRDCLGNTALHYATQMWPQYIVRMLLEHGANIGMKNHWNDIPIHKIQPETMESFLDEFCIESKGDVNHENFEVSFNYSFLAPPKEDLPLANREGYFNSTKVGEDPESQKLNRESSTASQKPPSEKVALPETQSLWYMAQSKEHRYLLKHPVVTSFLYLKWGKIRRSFNRNIRFYLLFVYVLTWYIFEKFGGLINPGDDYKSIPLFHGIFGLFCLIMLIFVLRDWIMDIREILKTERLKAKHYDGDPEDPDAGDQSSSCRVFLGILLSNWVEVLFLIFIGIILFGANTRGILWTALLILTCLLVFREMFQVTASLKRYLLSPENWIEVTVIVLILIILFYKSGSYELKRHLGAVAIVLSWAELITLIGKHPKLTRYNIYVMMFYKVMGTFFFFLCWYTFFIIAFGLGFYIMLHKNGPDDSIGEDDYIFFNSPWLALVKTSTMFVGELEFSDIPINIDSPLSPLAYIFFLSFVFLIVVVLMNLLNGLAVSDTGTIQEKAEIVSYISRVETISYTESILLGDPFNFLSNWPALKWFYNIPSCSFCNQLYKNRTFQKLFHKITGATGILLFYNFLPEKKLTLKPNTKNHSCNFLEIELMNEDIIASVKNIVLKKQSQFEELSRVESRISELERKIDLILTKL